MMRRIIRVAAQCSSYKISSAFPCVDAFFMEAIDVPEHLLNYFDYEAYGRDIRLEEDGHFAPGGYVLNNGGKFIEHYHGIEDIPAEHKVFAFPQLSVREQMAAYKEIIDGSSLEGYRKIAKKEHEER